VNVVEAYRNIVPSEASGQARVVFQRPYPDWVAFASSSAVTNLLTLIGSDVLNQVKIASIGPVTSDTARKHGLIIAAEARVHTVEGLVEAIAGTQLH
jgi:uroporphyrinogen III methyltransferase/synthase